MDTAIVDTKKPKRVSTQGRKKKTPKSSPSLQSVEGVPIPELSLAENVQDKRKKKEKIPVNDIEKRIKSLRKKAAAQSASIERLYTAQDENQQSDELSFDSRVDEEFKSMVEYKDYIINYDRLKKLPTFQLTFKTQLVDDDASQPKARSRVSKKLIVRPEVVDIEAPESDDWKNDLRTMTIRNKMVRIDDDKGLVYSSSYELIGSIEEFEMMDEEVETNELDENNNLNI